MIVIDIVLCAPKVIKGRSVMKGAENRRSTLGERRGTSSRNKYSFSLNQG